MILYEYPFNESIRTMLRLEHLFDRLDVLVARDAAIDHHFALATLFEVMDVAARADLKSDLLVDLERQRGTLAGFRGNPAISEAALEKAISLIDNAIAPQRGMQVHQRHVRRVEDRARRVRQARVALRRFNCLNCHQRDGEGGIPVELADIPRVDLRRGLVQAQDWQALAGVAQRDPRVAGAAPFVGSQALLRWQLSQDAVVDRCWAGLPLAVAPVRQRSGIGGALNGGNVHHDNGPLGAAAFEGFLSYGRHFGVMEATAQQRRHAGLRLVRLHAARRRAADPPLLRRQPAQHLHREIERLYQELQSAFDRASEVEAVRRNEQPFAGQPIQTPVRMFLRIKVAHINLSPGYSELS